MKQPLLLLGFSLAFLFVWEQLQSVRLGYQLETLYAQSRDQENKNAYLRLELEKLRSPQSLALAAQRRLKMSPPSPETLIVLGEPSVKPRPTNSAWFLTRLFSEPREFR
jgi:cell division protein FtsL